jgi:hypothetical protein
MPETSSDLAKGLTMTQLILLGRVLINAYREADEAYRKENNLPPRNPVPSAPPP